MNDAINLFIMVATELSTFTLLPRRASTVHRGYI